MCLGRRRTLLASYEDGEQRNEPTHGSVERARTRRYSSSSATVAAAAYGTTTDACATVSADEPGWNAVRLCGPDKTFAIVNAPAASVVASSELPSTETTTPSSSVGPATVPVTLPSGVSITVGASTSP